MSEDKIIIDGVDVSKCCNYDDTQFWECEPTNCHCEELPNCYYKQLKRKEQECKELNSDNRYFVNKIISLESLTDKYELAFKEIEKIIDNDPADTQTNNAKWLQQYYLTRFWEISNIINEVMGGE